MTSMSLFLVAAVLSSFILLCNAGSFEELCYKPLRFGKGKLTDNECEVTFPIDTVDKREALLVCETNSPFDVKSYSNGFPTRCTYVKGYMCDEGEHLVNDQCFAVHQFALFDQKACRHGHNLHVIRSMWEVKWISILFGININAVWIHEESTKWLKPMMHSKSWHTGAANLKIKLQLQAGLRTSAGVAMYGKSKEVLPHLCSRPAIALDATVQQISETMKLLGFSSGVTTDNTGRKRAFSVVPLMLPIRSSNNTLDLMFLHKSCRLFPNGYAASLNDFQDVMGFDGFKRTLSLGAYRTTGGRTLYADAVPHTSCKTCEDYMKNRKYWTYASTNSSQHPLPHSHWSSDHPRSSCADVPRTTLAMDSTYVDLPPIARRSVLCTYGNPPNLAPLNPDDQCNAAAYFDLKLKHCVCKDPKSDAKVRDPKKYADFPEGLICIDCEKTTNTTSIVFIIDDSGSVGQSGYDKQEKFILEILQKIGNARVGVVVLTADSYVGVPMDYNTKKEIEKWMAWKEWQNTYTGPGPALYEARKMLQAEETKKKFIIMFSDGDGDYCEGIFACSWLVRQKIRDHTYDREADLIHGLGIEVIFVKLPYTYTFWVTNSFKEKLNNRAHYIAKKPENVIEAENFVFTSEHLNKITNEVCKIEK